MNNYNDISDSELMSLLPEDEETIKDLIYQKYGVVIKYVLNKYNTILNIVHADEEEVRCEALLGFSDGIMSYIEGKNASLKTFLELCVERKVLKYISKFTTTKHKFLKDVISIDYGDGESSSLIEVVKDENGRDPLDSITFTETVNEIVSIAKNCLSKFEYEVFLYQIEDLKYNEIASKMQKSPKQIDNTIQRIRNKLKKNLNIEEIYKRISTK